MATTFNTDAQDLSLPEWYFRLFFSAKLEAIFSKSLFPPTLSAQYPSAVYHTSFVLREHKKHTPARGEEMHTAVHRSAHNMQECSNAE